MRILVCARIGLDGEINPFDACAYELALSQNNAEVSIISMGIRSAEGVLKNLTRLGAKHAYLLNDTAFAGADTLATAYALSMAVHMIKPDLVFCGRQTLIGDTGQTAVMLAEKAGYELITNVMEIAGLTDDRIVCNTREEGRVSASLPALITVERINKLRLPSLRSVASDVQILTAADIGADPMLCGFSGSPTRVLETFENQRGKRKCVFRDISEIKDIIKSASAKMRNSVTVTKSDKLLSKVLCITDAPLEYAKTVCDTPIVINDLSLGGIINSMQNELPDVVLFGSDAVSRRVAARIAAKLDLGLCADCTSLQTDGKTLYMIRPALSGSVIAKIKSETVPAMATVRTAGVSNNIIVTAGYGVKDHIDAVRTFSRRIGAELCATRKCVDNGIFPYEMQVGLTGKTVSPAVYIAIGVSGAVQHIVGMDRSGTVIAVNPDKNAPIFEYADYGIVYEFR